MSRRFEFILFFGVVWLYLALLAGPEGAEAAQLPRETSGRNASVEKRFFVAERWSFHLGLAMITSNTIGDIGSGYVRWETGQAKGQMYLLGASYKLKELDWRLGGHHFRPRLEIPVVVGVTEEEGRRHPFGDYNFGVTLRWMDFPFNRYVYTNLETGVGLSFTEHVLATEHKRHPGRDRSRLKFYWPIHVSLAHPGYKRHQLLLFVHHQSGGLIFDKGGSNLLGIGYRWTGD